MNDDKKYIIPELSDEIEFNPLNNNEYILSNSKHKHYLKINGDTYNLLLLIDGKRGVFEICDLYNNKFDKKITHKIISDLLFIKLLRFGIIKGFEKYLKGYEKPSYLKLSFIIINERVLSKIVAVFYFLFNRRLAVFLIVSSMVITITLFLQNLNLFQAFNLQESLVYFMIIMSISLIFHEIGHATSTNYFGANHGGIGFGFYLLSPVYYADVTDIWRLKKRERIIVNLSGIYFELIFCSIISMIGYLTGNYILLVVSIAVFIHTLYNLNPFLRSDGYWILSDLIETPNLAFHAIDKLKDVVRLFQGKDVKWTRIDLLLFFYGITNTFFICFFLYYIIIKNPNSIILFHW